MLLVMQRSPLKKIQSPRLCWRREFSTTLLMEGDDADDLGLSYKGQCYVFPEESWRKASREHATRVREILRPGLTPQDHPLNTGIQRQRRQQERKEQRRNPQGRQPSVNDDPKVNSSVHDTITALDPKHPVYNFLIEYYGLKGTKGVRRLMKWPPGMNGFGTTKRRDGGILLEGATDHDFFTSLHTKGAIHSEKDEGLQGVVFSPSRFVCGGNHPNTFHPHENGRHPPRDGKRDLDKHGNANQIASVTGGPLAPFLWYRSLLQQSLEATPVLHCYGLHEWAMQYQPTTTNNNTTLLPPSSKYQSHLKLRVDPETLSKTVETNTLFCTHVDAWKFFAKEALPLNQFHKQAGSNSNARRLPHANERPEWLLRSEQPACVHTTMDLLKIALKLGPFCDPNLFCKVLEITVDARFLDVAASPYDAQTDYGVDPILIETSTGRNEYKQRQMELMKKANPIRRELLENYEQFLSVVY